MKSGTSDMHEGPEALERFTNAVKAALTVKKSDMPPSPFAKSVKKHPVKRELKPLR